jgi:hypothetical protein
VAIARIGDWEVADQLCVAGRTAAAVDCAAGVDGVADTTGGAAAVAVKGAGEAAVAGASAGALVDVEVVVEACSASKADFSSCFSASPRSLRQAGARRSPSSSCPPSSSPLRVARSRSSS